MIPPKAHRASISHIFFSTFPAISGPFSCLILCKALSILPTSSGNFSLSHTFHASVTSPLSSNNSGGESIPSGNFSIICL